MVRIPRNLSPENVRFGFIWEIVTGWASSETWTLYKTLFYNCSLQFFSKKLIAVSSLDYPSFFFHSLHTSEWIFSGICFSVYHDTLCHAIVTENTVCLAVLAGGDNLQFLPEGVWEGAWRECRIMLKYRPLFALMALPLPTTGTGCPAGAGRGRRETNWMLKNDPKPDISHCQSFVWVICSLSLIFRFSYCQADLDVKWQVMLGMIFVLDLPRDSVTHLTWHCVTNDHSHRYHDMGGGALLWPLIDVFVVVNPKANFESWPSCLK